MPRFPVVAGALALLYLLSLASVDTGAQRGSLFMGAADDPAIAYSTGPLDNVVDDLNRRLEGGAARLTFDGRAGYLGSLLEALELPADSQLLVFSQLSLQGRFVKRTNPRALYFNDRVALGWVRDAPLIEIAAHDATKGTVFYTLEQRPSERPRFTREFRCLGCHQSGDTLGVPGLMTFSTTPDVNGQGERVVAVDQRTPARERFGGWFVSGDPAAFAHSGERTPPTFDRDGYRAASSDIAALLAFSHQTYMTNLLTRAGWEARAADPALHGGRSPSRDAQRALDAVLSGVAAEVVDYMLFVDEAPLPSAVSASSSFRQRMAARGPRDRRGRSLFELDLNTRLLKYPCSYLVYSPAFAALPAPAKAAVYTRLWQVLSGELPDPRYRRLSLTDRRAVVEILRDTKPDLPAYFTSVSK